MGVNVLFAHGLDIKNCPRECTISVTVKSFNYRLKAVSAAKRIISSLSRNPRRRKQLLAARKISNIM